MAEMWGASGGNCLSGYLRLHARIQGSTCSGYNLCHHD